MADAEVAPPAATQPQSDGSGPLETAVANETRGDGAPNATPAAGEADEQGPEAEGPGATAEAEVPGATAEAEAEDVGEAPQVVFDFEALPQDVETMVMTGATQAIFSCKMDEDVTASNPYKLIPLEAIKEDIRNRAGVSDMAPFKEKMNKYEGTEVLIVYDRNFTFDACFWCCTTEGAKVAFLQHMREKEEAAQQAAKEEEAAAVEAVAAKRSAGWTNLGSDLEIDAARVVPERPLMQLMMSRKRRLFGAPLTLSDSTYPEDRVEYAPREVLPVAAWTCTIGPCLLLPFALLPSLCVCRALVSSSSRTCVLLPAPIPTKNTHAHTRSFSVASSSLATCTDADADTAGTTTFAHGLSLAGFFPT